MADTVLPLGGPRVIGVPAYFHPAVAADDWTALARPGIGVSPVVLNIADGPGTAREPELHAVATRAAEAGIPVIGYVDTAYGERSLTDVTAEMARYRAWYRIAGFFLDQAATAPRKLEWYRLVADTARINGESVVFNHGTYPDAEYAELADTLVTFEGPWSAYRELEAPAWVRGLPTSQFWHLVYDTPEALLAQALDRAALSHVDTVYVTDRGGANPWGGLPSYFDQLISAC